MSVEMSDIETVREQLDQAMGLLGNLKSYLAVQNTEVERLRERVKLLEGMEGGEYASANRLRGEVERLQADNEQHLQQWTRDIEDGKRRFDQEKEAFRAEHAEVERLRAVLDRALGALDAENAIVSDAIRNALAEEKV
jgi:chromosome segregation ATPase